MIIAGCSTFMITLTYRSTRGGDSDDEEATAEPYYASRRLCRNCKVRLVLISDIIPFRVSGFRFFPGKKIICKGYSSSTLVVF